MIIYKRRELRKFRRLAAQAVRSFYHFCGMRWNLKWQFMFFIFIYYVCHNYILYYPSGPVKLAAWSLQLLFSFYFSGQGASRVI
jgi:hypothetical protein